MKAAFFASAVAVAIVPLIEYPWMSTWPTALNIEASSAVAPSFVPSFMIDSTVTGVLLIVTLLIEALWLAVSTAVRQFTATLTAATFTSAVFNLEFALTVPSAFTFTLPASITPLPVMLAFAVDAATATAVFMPMFAMPAETPAICGVITASAFVPYAVSTLILFALRLPFTTSSEVNSAFETATLSGRITLLAAKPRFHVPDLALLLPALFTLIALLLPKTLIFEALILAMFFATFTATPTLTTT